ncbi:class I SAM-dependent methyltransferase [Amycolatopsis nigrescens]|uniref:class I SAM-dependent methyltransferase n=1 Tax=Amycolatopsis nigrescens TaxID=381445 RepID=UPI0003668D47|nr:methyltransferase domain-containing protein [Amycolatopsis nigrescens]
MSISTEFLRHPLRTGAVAASSRWLAAEITGGLGLERAPVVAELGPGTGAFTGAILSRLAPGARLVAVEWNPRLAEGLRERHADDPVDVVRGRAEDLAEHLPGPVDVVVSGLPWAAMPEARQRRILDAVLDVLGPDGRFSTFAYAHAAWTGPARRFAALLAERFGTLERGRVVWPNLPPAFVHRASSPLTPGGSVRSGLFAAAAG